MSIFEEYGVFQHVSNMVFRKLSVCACATQFLFNFLQNMFVSLLLLHGIDLWPKEIFFFCIIQ